MHNSLKKKEAGELIKTELGEKYECTVIDVFLIGHQDAILVRKVCYKNNGNEPFPISLSNHKHYFSTSCKDFKCSVLGNDVEPNISQHSYNKEVSINGEFKLNKGEELEFKIECTWKHFALLLNDININFKYSDECKYQIIFKNFNLKEHLHHLLIENKLRKENNGYHITINEVYVDYVTCSPNRNFNLRIVTLNTPIELPTLSVFAYKEETVFKDFVVILIQHLLSDFVHFVKALRKYGAIIDHTFIIGIPYSTKDIVLDYLSNEGYKNVKSPLYYPFNPIVKDTIEKAIETAKKNSKKILIVEDGGYAVPIIHSDFKHEIDIIHGAVEQTANGIWRDKEIIKDGSPLGFPVINVAESNLKKEQESPLIGRAVCKNIEILFGKSFFGLIRKKIGLMGFGSTGTEIATVLQSSNCELLIFDDREERLSQAKDLGFTVANDVEHFIEKSNLIIEATGNIWCNSNEILMLNHDSYFVSGSSKRLGINYDEFSRLVKIDSQIHLPGVGSRYTLQNNHDITLLADGFPINFFSAESVPDNEIAFIYALLFEAARVLASSNYYSNEIIDMNDTKSKGDFLKIQEEIKLKHIQLTS